MALLFHGNAENLTNFVQMQRWLLSLGIASYSVEYRGYSGRNSGWPSENGFYADGEAAFALLQKEEHTDPKDVIIFGSSIGTGTAAYIAQKFNVGTLVLLSPYTSLRDVAAETPLFGYLSPFLKYTFPAVDYVSQLTRTCVVDAHGKMDFTIPFSHSENLKKHYGGNNLYQLVVSEEAGHNDVMLHVRKQVEEALQHCISN